MKITTARNAVIAAALFLNSAVSIAQEGDRPTLYVSVDCMKSTAAEYTNVEVGIWLPMHQALVDQGKRNNWALYSVAYGDRSRCDHYAVTTYLGEQQLNSPFAVAELFDAVHKDGDLTNAMARTWSSRQRVATELWMAVDGTEIKKHRYAVVNMMRAADPDAYQRVESRVFKPGHQALVDGGHRAGWAMYELLAPLGTSIPYNFSTVDFVDHLSPVPMAEALITAHPDRDLDEIQELLAVRDHVSSEIWKLVAATTWPETR